MPVARRVLVTGSEGFTGKYVCDALTKTDWEVWRAGLNSSVRAPRYLQLDLLDPASLFAIDKVIQPEVVIHLAAAAFIHESNPEVFYQVNLLGTRNLLTALSTSRHPPDCVIIASSANVYGDSGGLTLSEESAVNPQNDYSVSKLATEYLAKTFVDELGIVITRPFNYTGVGQSARFLVPKLVHHFVNKIPKIQLGNINVARDFSDVRDIAGYYAGIAALRPIGETINLCSGSEHTLQNIIDLLSELSNFQIEIQIKNHLQRRNEVDVLRGDRTKLDELIAPKEQRHIEETLMWMLQN